jgi:hypothetical protein
MTFVKYPKKRYEYPNIITYFCQHNSTAFVYVFFSDVFDMLVGLKKLPGEAAFFFSSLLPLNNPSGLQGNPPVARKAFPSICSISLENG